MKMNTPLAAAVLLIFSGPATAQSHAQHHPAGMPENAASTGHNCSQQMQQMMQMHQQMMGQMQQMMQMMQMMQQQHQGMGMAMPKSTPPDQNQPH